ncbi:MAG: lipoxygenase family protein [Polyangiales bacterium]
MTLIPELPSLPDADPLAARRARSLADGRSTYAWDWSWPPGCATLRALPERDRYPVRFIADTASLQVAVRANRLALTLDGVERPARSPDPADPDPLNPHDLTDEIVRGAPTTHPASVDDYARYFVRLPVPASLTQRRANPADGDLQFAWQRVGGANPMSLRRCARLPDDLALPATLWDRVVGTRSLAATLDEGRLFEVDFTLLHGVATNRYLDRQKYLSGARGVFTSVKGPLQPVVIQLEPGGPVYAPGDGVAWEMAKYAFQVADANVHETMEHLGATHMVMEALGIAARRQLAPQHPLRLLLEPHLAGTFAINHSAKTSLIAPEGVIDRVFAARIDLAAGLVRASLDRFSLQDCAPAQRLVARGVHDRETLPENPYRDDIVRVYDAVAAFVDAYVRIYYPDDAAVQRDPELRAWVAEVGSPIGGNLRGVRPVERVADLVTWMANALHIASAQHAAVNFPQYDCFGWGANAAGACWAPPPGAHPTDADLLAQMPPWDCLMLQADTVYQLAGVYYGRLGDYALLDPRAAAAAASFQSALRDVERAIDADDAARARPYPYLRPSKIPASINI